MVTSYWRKKVNQTCLETKHTGKYLELRKFLNLGYYVRRECVIDRAIDQAVIWWCLTAKARVRARSGHRGFVMDKVALGQVFSEYFGFPCQSSFHQILKTHNNHPGQVQWANWWPTCRVDPVGLHSPLFELRKTCHLYRSSISLA
jgi:hypothetical protein